MSRKSLQDRWARLKSMSSDELLDRVRQYGSARSDAARWHLGLKFDVEFRPCKSEPRFFFAPSAVPEMLQLLKARLPGYEASLVERAEKTCQHRFDLLGYRDLGYGADIDWHTDRVHGKTAPRRPFYQVKYLDFDEVGDSKVTWELNRHQHFLTLAKAYRLTGNEKYSAELLKQWRHWQAENPYPIGINWASSLEVAFRSLSWIWMRYLMGGTAAWTEECHRDWLHWLALSGRHIERYLSTYFSPNTHLLGEAVALFFIGTMCPEVPGAEPWKQRGWKIVLEEAQRQVQADGLHFEQSTYYHVYALDFFLHTRILAAANGTESPQAFDATLVRMLDALLMLSRAGVPPSLGDDDGGRLFDPERNRTEHLLDPLSTGAVLFRRGDYKFLSRNVCEETVWLLGPDAARQFDELEEREPASHSAGLTTGGLYLMASADQKSQLIVDAGPHGAATAGHGHADALSLTLIKNGRVLLIDPGTCEYVGDGPERQQFRGTAAHNTLRVDGVDQADVKGPFAWANHPKTHAERWITGEQFDFFAGCHDGYERLASPVVHTRYVFALKSGLCLVRDVAQGTGQHHLDLWWHLGPGLNPRPNHRRTYEYPQSRFALLTPDLPGCTREEVQGLWSPAYGTKDPAPVVRLAAHVSLPVELATLLVVGSADMECGEFSHLSKRTAAPPVSVYRYKSSIEEHCFYFRQNQKPWSFETVASDAEFAYTCVRADGARCVIFCNGSYLEAGGARIISCTKPLERCEVIEASARTQVFSNEKEAAVSVGNLSAIVAEFETVVSASSRPVRQEVGN
jgi:hypothetical protein